MEYIARYQHSKTIYSVGLKKMRDLHGDTVHLKIRMTQPSVSLSHKTTLQCYWTILNRGKVVVRKGDVHTYVCQRDRGDMKPCELRPDCKSHEVDDKENSPNISVQMAET
jgi:hypothetical protein